MYRSGGHENQPRECAVGIAQLQGLRSHVPGERLRGELAYDARGTLGSASEPG